MSITVKTSSTFARNNVADGTSDVIAGLTARRFCWNSAQNFWYPSEVSLTVKSPSIFYLESTPPTS
jgi:hypothetical protein